MRTWVNGELLTDPRASVLTALDHGLTVGDGVFEVVKAVAGRPFALDLHLERMARSAAGLGLPALDADAVRRGVTEVLGAERLPFAKVRATWTGGPSPLGSGRGAGPPSLVVVSDAMDPWPETAAVVSVPWPRNERGALAGLKTTSYGENVRALARAREHGASEGIFANLQGWLCEGTGTNVFYVLDGQLRTPTLRSGCLAGITRHLVLEWYGAVETDAPIEEILHASEVFLTSTTRDVQGVHRWDQRELTAPGPVTIEVKKMWQDRQGELLGG